jgi:KDO2-lipid IV(A) lauroyltransferase
MLIWVLRGLRWLVARLPVPVGRWLACRAGDGAYYLAGRGRRAAISNMRHVLGPQATWGAVRRAAHQVFQNVALDYYDLLRMPDLSDADLERQVIFDEAGFRGIRPLLDEGQRIIMVTAHYGAIDMAARILQLHGWKVAFLADRLGDSALLRFLRQVRERSGNEFLMHEEGAGMLRRLISTLRAGRTVGVLADRNVTLDAAGSLRVSFFGEEALLSTAIARLALRSKALIVPAFCYREGRKYVVTIGTPITPGVTDQPEQDVATLTRRIAAVYEQMIGRHPEQWLLLSPVWPEPVVRSS